eukprot:989861_1
MSQNRILLVIMSQKDTMVSVLFLLHGIFVVSIAEYPFTRQYQNSTIDYIIGAIENGFNEQLIIYLGHRSSLDDCADNCINLNYLCGKSADDVYIFADGGEWQFDNATCSATSTHTLGHYGSLAILTSNMISNEYWIDIEVSVLDGQAGCILFKSNQIQESYYSGLQCVNPDRQILLNGGYDGGAYYEYFTPYFNFTYNTKYNTSWYFNNGRFTAYVNGELSSTQDIGIASRWSDNFAGLRTYKATVIYHSFKIRFPDPHDNTDQKVCRAFLYNKDSGHCYGYYGNDYEVIEKSISSDNQYDSGIIYDTAQPTQVPTKSIASAPTTAQQETVEPTMYEPTIVKSTMAVLTTSEPNATTLSSHPTAPITTVEPTTTSSTESIIVETTKTVPLKTNRTTTMS